ncbi:MAG TPA: hypothetical protein VNX86_07520 [Rhizomicrobium sp.]|jgi:hypothetical protein|nr:hypothetical protein [Rhizomicrobium sp.]
MGANEFRELAVELVDRHGSGAVQFARNCSTEYAFEGAHVRSEFWYALSVFLDDIVSHRIDPDRPLAFH